jgi:hypothetical protein
LRHRGVGREGTVELAPKSLVRAFGPATDESWDSESLGGYYFVTPDDRPFSVYFRAYDQPPSLIRTLRRTFWEESASFEFSMGALGAEGVPQFRSWLLAQVKR